MDENINFLIAQAVALAGGNTCAAGHDWQSDGAARRCPHDAEQCSQMVYRCSRCGVYDYGEPGGPGFAECEHGACSQEAGAIVESLLQVCSP